MLETEPKYFTDFRKIVLTRFDQIDKKFNSIEKRLDDEFEGINARLDSHAEQIAEMATNIITIKHLLHKKADKGDVESLDRRVTSLEKASNI
ncbi:MAG: hypothetical protein HZA80_03590 [Candidatus Taylorbacteria bacterium]|nr:hypothetical protein [Candidatus Taylorbacteria bacterium]